MYYYLIELLTNIFEQNQDALMAIPTEVKTILVIALGIWAVTALAKGAMKMLKYVLIAAIIYVGCVYFGIL